MQCFMNFAADADKFAEPVVPEGHPDKNYTGCCQATTDGKG